MSFRVNLERKAPNPIARIISGDFSKGFNPAETLLSAAGACLTSAILLVAKNSAVEIGDVHTEIQGVRQSDPPRLISLHYDLVLDSPATDEKIEQIITIAKRNSTVLSTLSQALEVTGEWKRGNNG